MSKSALSERIISNLAHVLAYASLAFVWFCAFGMRQFGKRRNVLHPLIPVSLIVFAISDEIHRSFVPGRTASFMDVGLDILGISMGLGGFQFLGAAGHTNKK